MCRTWQRLNPDAKIHVAYGGTAATFQALDWPDRSFIEDPRLRTRDHQRERQSYRGIMQAAVADLAGSATKHILMVECDVVPLQPGLVHYLEERARMENADVLGVKLLRADGTSHPHFLAHQSHPQFNTWLEQSIREDQGVVLMTLGCLTCGLGRPFAPLLWLLSRFRFIWNWRCPPRPTSWVSGYAICLNLRQISNRRESWRAFWSNDVPKDDG